MNSWEKKYEAPKTKFGLAKILVSHPLWAGEKNPLKLSKMYTKPELIDLVEQIDEAEHDEWDG